MSANDTVFRICEAITVTVGLICAAAVLLSPVACTVHRNDLVYQAIKAGHDPISTRCALGNTSSLTEPPCVNKTASQQTR